MVIATLSYHNRLPRESPQKGENGHGKPPPPCENAQRRGPGFLLWRFFRGGRPGGRLLTLRRGSVFLGGKVGPERGGRGKLVEPSYELFHELELEQGCGIIHSKTDYDNILADMKLDGDPVVLAATDDDGRSAMLFAVADGEEAVKVKWLLGESKYAVRTLLVELRRIVGQKDITVITPPYSGDKGLMRPYGMARILRPGAFLSDLALSHPELRLTVRIDDDLIPSNTGIYTVADGKCVFVAGTDASHDIRADLDVTAEAFTAIVFSSHSTSEIIGLPACRPAMGLMLDQ